MVKQCGAISAFPAMGIPAFTAHFQQGMHFLVPDTTEVKVFLFNTVLNVALNKYEVDKKLVHI